MVKLLGEKNHYTLRAYPPEHKREHFLEQLASMQLDPWLQSRAPWEVRHAPGPQVL